MNKAKPRDILLTAADLIENGGWVQEQYSTRDGAYCLMGAVETVHRKEVPEELEIRESQPVYSKLWASLFEAVGGNPIAWNDEPGRTAEEVVSMIRKAAENV